MASAVFIRLELAAMGTQSSPPPEEGLVGSIRLCEAGGDEAVNGNNGEGQRHLSFFLRELPLRVVIDGKLLLYTRKNKTHEVG